MRRLGHVKPTNRKNMKYKLITIGTDLYLVEDTTDGKRKWITEAEILADIFTDPIFADID